VPKLNKNPHHSITPALPHSRTPSLHHFITSSLLISLFLLLGTLHAQIAIYGDTRSNPDTHRKVVAAMTKHEFKIAFHAGDLNSYGTQQKEYDLFHQITAPLTDKCTLWPARGNHEGNLELFLKNFPALKGKSYYTVRHDGIRFIILDSVQSLKPGSEQYKWLAGTLADSLASIIIMHHPVFSSGANGDGLGLQQFLPNLLQKWNVKAVFCAHDHHYERSVFKGISYIVTGGGGAPLREPKHDNSYSLVFVQNYQFIIANRKGDAMQFTVYGLDDRILDSFTLKGF